ncbi:hypothetical protein Mlute_02822 [Meiothermus luteus]|jgi:hypothetical protein|uniref:Photosynthesis system II assembly factor Ycf48/Hcf136-like domain-containing protein n=1 Tax=Meiothermus luteus TaxID=2026184 RepID=A0A399EGF9_9DEIN|nr:hypothetical protein [Meiothermus luteus]RIH81371.1 hypothetical protein Mlute_02822 [Meiothermus luteus]
MPLGLLHVLLLLLLLPACARPPQVETRTLILEDAGGTVAGVAFGQGVFVAVAPFRIFLSEDGERWEVIGVPVRLNAVRYSEVGFLAVGNAGYVFRSQDGRTWERFNVGREWDLSDVAYGGGVYVLLAERGEILVTRDLRHVRRVRLDLPEGYGVYEGDYGRGRFVLNADVFRMVLVTVKGE